VMRLSPPQIATVLSTSTTKKRIVIRGYQPQGVSHVAYRQKSRDLKRTTLFMTISSRYFHLFGLSSSQAWRRYKCVQNDKDGSGTKSSE
jgi:hypothetical protein